jgi:mycothiol synthase
LTEAGRFHVRRLGPHDVDAYGALVARATDAGELLGSSAPHGEWLDRFPHAEPSEVAVAAADGRLVGLVLPEVKALVVEPAYRRRGIGRALVDAGLEIERERGRPNLLVGALPGDDAARSFLRATGFELHSTLWDLDLPAGTEVQPPRWPEHVSVRAFDPARDVGPWVDLFNAAFADHATPLQLDREREAEEWASASERAADLLVVVGEGGTLVGFCSTDPRTAPDGRLEPRGEIWTIGVDPRWQGQGLGRQLLRWGVHHLRGLGVTTVTLGVNGRNPRALGLYEAEGFVRTATRERWARPVEPG